MWEACGRRVGGVWEAGGRRWEAAGVWDACGRCVGGVWEAVRWALAGEARAEMGFT